VILIVLVLLPVALLTVYSGLDRREHDGVQTRERAVQLATSIGQQQADAIRGAGELLGPLVTLLSQLPSVDDLEPEACVAFFALYAGEGARYASVMLTTTEGRVICGSAAVGDPINLGEQPIAQTAVGTPGVVVGAVQTPPSGPPVLPVAQALLGADGSAMGVLIFNIDLSTLRFTGVDDLPEGAFVTLYSSAGIILARHPEGVGIVGRDISQSENFRRIIETGAGTLDSTSAEGTPSLIAYTALDDARSLYISVGLPEAFAYADANQALRRNLLLLGVVMAGSFAFALFASEHILLRPLRRVGSAAQAIAAGEHATRIGPNYGVGEIANVGQAFDQMADAIAQREAEVRELNATLERRVEERTAQLQEANRELESFSYSVSHDLRAPLRAVDGFSDMLESKYRADLPEEAQRFLSRIRGATRRMGDLIDDLLQFSRVTRSEMTLRDTSLDAITEEAIDDIRTGDPDANIEWRLDSLGTVEVDAGLMRRVMANLLGNAVKFSRDRQPAIVHIGREERDGECAYFVRDNGVGFDMAHAHAMFGVFQRLHLQEEFEGTGVGLAIVDRIVRRHGGRIWAEGSPDKGATFFFTLPDRSNGDD